jgi:hypothetical protein
MTVGVVSGLGAILFNFLLTSGTRFFMNDLAAWVIPESWRSVRLFGFPPARWLLIAIPALGGLISGFLVYRFAPEAEGHGTDAMIDSFHRKGGAVRPLAPVIKTVASAITIGSGGSAGKEGPIAQIGSGFASILATLLKMDEPSRRLMLLAGAAGGIGAIFKAPLGAALFATEVLYRKPEFEFEGIIPCIISSIVAFTVYSLYTGYGTIFTIPNLAPVTDPAELLLYGFFGILCAAVGYVYVRVFYGMRDLFAGRLRMNKMYRPAIGGRRKDGHAHDADPGLCQDPLHVPHDRLGRERGRLRAFTLHRSHAGRGLRHPLRKHLRPVAPSSRRLRPGGDGRVLCRCGQSSHRRSDHGGGDDRRLQPDRAADDRFDHFLPTAGRWFPV